MSRSPLRSRTKVSKSISLSGVIRTVPICIYSRLYNAAGSASVAWEVIDLAPDPVNAGRQSNPVFASRACGASNNDVALRTRHATCLLYPRPAADVALPLQDFTKAPTYALPRLSALTRRCGAGTRRGPSFRQVRRTNAQPVARRARTARNKDPPISRRRHPEVGCRHICRHACTLLLQALPVSATSSPRPSRLYPPPRSRSTMKGALRVAGVRRYLARSLRTMKPPVRGHPRRAETA
jgi:hypothetical protein